MRLLPALLMTLVCTSAVAEEHEWVLRVKKEAHQVAISLGGHTVVGSGPNRVKGSGVVVERVRSVSPFTRVRLDGPTDLRLVAADKEGVRVVADDNIEPLLSTVVEGDTLVVGLKPGAAFTTRHALQVTVDFRTLQALQIKGSGDAHLERLKADRLELQLSGSGDARIGLLEVKELVASLSGSGDLALAGRADAQEWSLSGSGDVSAASLTGQRVTARLSGSGDLRLGVAQEVDAVLSGSGDLSYAGRPQVRSKVSGSGELMQR